MSWNSLCRPGWTWTRPPASTSQGLGLKSCTPIYVCIFVLTGAMAQVWRSEDDLQDSIFSFHSVSSGNQIQIGLAASSFTHWDISLTPPFCLFYALLGIEKAESFIWAKQTLYQPSYITSLFVLGEAGSHVAQASLKLTLQSRMTLNPSFSVPSSQAGFMGIYHQD